MAGLSVNLYGSVGPIPTPLYPSRLGRGLKGFIPQALITTNNSFKDFEQERYLAVNAWNTTFPAQLVAANKGRVITPFRAVTNAGDLLARPYYSCGGACQTFQSRPGVFGLKGHFGAIQSLCDGTGIPPAACNVKYVYDSSNYSSYLKLRAVAQNYNDLSYGGNQNNGSQSYYRAIRRY